MVALTRLSVRFALLLPVVLRARYELNLEIHINFEFVFKGLIILHCDMNINKKTKIIQNLESICRYTSLW